jgi:hypothetical protein
LLIQPLSEKSKNYVLKLDIDADVNILKETLNICQEAVDYFRSSSKLLQEGVKAGLTLYDIAIMCCRNDDLGEIPSKLEILSNMAAELATTAVENGRWHHTAAVNAIAEQLSPVAGGSLLANLESKLATGSGFVKSASSANFSSLSCDLAGDLVGAEDECKGDVPGMAQSSASDESSDVGDTETDQEEREEWAAAVIADVSMDQSMSMMHMQQQRRRSRSHSVAEDDSSVLSSSPRGFWCVRPGSSSLDDNSFDNDSFSWSPHASPHMLPRALHDFPKEDLRRMPDFTTSLGPETIAPPTVTFAESFSSGFLLPPPATINVTTSFKKPMVLPTLQRKPSGGGIPRSKSYSAFSGISSSLLTNSSSDFAKRVVVQKDDGWRTYFSKFVDLVIIRETSALAQTRNGN